MVLKEAVRGRTLAELAQSSAGSHWGTPDDVFASALGMPSPSFRLARGSKIVTVGSCFARNIEEALRDRGYVLPMLAVAVSKEEWSGERPNGILNRYTIGSIAQTFAWAERIYSGAGFQEATQPFFLETEAGIVDIDLAGLTAVTPERAWQRRRQIYEAWCPSFDGAQVIVLTLGQHESWLFEPRGLLWGNPPVERALVSVRPSTTLQLPALDELVDQLLLTIDSVREHNPSVRFLVSVSPVPASRYYNGQDALVSYWWSKSLLRSIAATVTQRRTNVDYFPGFELVHANGRDAWMPDGIHVRDEVVRRIVDRLVATYEVSADATALG